jgi:hypothetical protein
MDNNGIVTFRHIIGIGRHEILWDLDVTIRIEMLL